MSGVSVNPAEDDDDPVEEGGVNLGADEEGCVRKASRRLTSFTFVRHLKSSVVCCSPPPHRTHPVPLNARMHKCMHDSTSIATHTA